MMPKFSPAGEPIREGGEEGEEGDTPVGGVSSAGPLPAENGGDGAIFFHEH